MILHDPFGAQEPRAVSTDGKRFAKYGSLGLLRKLSKRQRVVKERGGSKIGGGDEELHSDFALQLLLSSFGARIGIPKNLSSQVLGEVRVNFLV